MLSSMRDFQSGIFFRAFEQIPQFRLEIAKNVLIVSPNYER